MEGNTLMEIQEAALKMLRQGKSVLEVEQELLRVMNEVRSMKVYIQAIQDSDFAP